jgi:hypothetical protein
MKNSLRLLIFLFALSFCVRAQDNAQPPRIKSSLCTRDNALTIVQQQIDFTKTFDDDYARVTVLLRSAGLIWPFEEKKARATYTDAFDVATRHFKEKGDEITGTGRMLIRQEDPRYVVIAAIAKHDAAWAKRLTDQLLKEQQQEADDKADKDTKRDLTTAERLLSTANSVLSTDENAALNFARSSLRYPATLNLASFLYQLSERDKSAADQFYQEALAAYASAPIERLLYLSSYPFGNDRDAGDMPGYIIYQVPAGFVPNPVLQRVFVQTLMQRAQTLIADPGQASRGTRRPDMDELWLAFTRLQPQIQKSLPDFSPAIETTRTNLSAKLSPDSQQDLQQKIEGDNPPVQTFDEKVETALKNPDVDRRDEQLAMAVLRSSDEPLDHVLDVLEKIADTSLHEPLRNWLYFDRTQRAIKEKKLDDARKLAAKVDELDHRAFLYMRIAEESLKQNSDQTEAREVLEAVLDAAAKAPNTQVKVRALLGVAYLYTKFDMTRAVEVIGGAVHSINQIEHPDFRQQSVMRKIEGKTFASYAGFVTPGFNPENAFREIGKVDFDSMLNQASNFSDKLIRAMTTLAIVEQCLKDQAAKPKPANKGTTAKP